MRPEIVVVDYEMGNLHSVGKALEKAGAKVRITGSASAIKQADGVVLPGVGAFGEAVKRLKSKKLITPLLDALERNKHFLGICLGLQLLFERSEESPHSKGLGFLKGDVVKFRVAEQSSLKVPHMGWNTLAAGPALVSKSMKTILCDQYFYFVHSYFPAPEDARVIATRTHYGRPFCSSIGQGNLYASQFHPEKSGPQGQRLLKHFVQEVSAC